LLVHSTSPTWRRLERVLSSTSLGLVSQALAFVVGVLVIRSLDRTEYVSYSLSGAIVAAVAIIADSGIASTLTAAAARAENATRFRALLTAALRRRRTVWGVAIAPTLALLVYLLLKAGIAPVPALIVAALTGALSYNSLSIGLAAIDYQLGGRTKILQGLDVLNAALRVGFVLLGGLLGVDSAIYYVLLALAIGLLQMRIMTRQVRARHPVASVTSEDETLFTRAVRSTLASTVFLIIGEQLVNVILVQRGNPLAIADITALSRFALAFSVVNVVVGNLVVPYLAKAGATRGVVARKATSAVLAYAVVCAAYVGGVIVAAPLLLRILGPQYDHLHTELVIIAVGTALSNFAFSGIGMVVHARGWVAHSWTQGIFLAGWIIYGCFFADVSTTTGAAVLAATLSLPVLLTNIVRTMGGLHALPTRESVET
jgi:hypothetical protein